MAGIGVVLNPHSSSNKRNPGRVERLGFIVGDKGSCHATNTLEDVEQLAIQFREREIEVLGISGGDGTLHATLSAFVKVYGDQPLPTIAFLRGGTMNNVANTIGVHGSPESILSNVIVKYHHGQPFRTTRLPLLRVNNSYGFIFGMGVVSRYLEHYCRTPRGPLWAAWVLGYYMWSSAWNGAASHRLCEKFNARVICDGVEQPLPDHMMLFAGTIESLTLGFRPLYRTRKIGDQFQLVSLSTTPRGLLRKLPRAWFGLPMRNNDLNDALDIVGKKITLEMEQPQLYSIDGDFPEAPVSRIELSLGPTLNCILG